MHVTRAPIGQRHRPEQPEAADQIGTTRPRMQRQADAPDRQEQRGDDDANQHAGEHGKGEAGALGAPLDGQRRG